MNMIDMMLDQSSDRDETILAILRGLWETSQHQARLIERLHEEVQILKAEAQRK